MPHPKPITSTPVFQLPGCVPATFAERLAGRTVRFALPAGVRRRLKTPARIDPVTWAERYRVVTDGPHTGRWRRSLAPQAVKIMEVFSKQWVREVWLCGVEQASKTNAMLNVLGWSIDVAPGNIFYRMPTESTMNKVFGSKVRPMLRQSPRLKKYLSARADDTTLEKIELAHGVTIFPAYANSPASMATWPAKYCYVDEVDKCPTRSGKETDPITLIRKRLRTWRGRGKAFYSSTPAQQFIYSGMRGCVQQWEYRLRCIGCGELIAPDGECLVIPEEVTAAELDPARVRLACPSCGLQLDEPARLEGARRAAWVCVAGAEVRQPRTVGFHLPAWGCLDISLHEIATAWLKAQAGKITDVIAWHNGYLAQDYEDERHDRDYDDVLKHVDGAMPRSVVPADPAALILVADTQQVGFYYNLWAFGFGEALDAWVIQYGYVEHFSALIDLAAQNYTDAVGTAYRPLAGFIDSGGGTDPHHPQHSRTAEVYEFCRQNPFFKPLKGRRDQAQPWNISRLDYYPNQGKGKKVAIPGGINLYLLNVTLYKGDLHRKLMLDPGAAGSIRLHADTDKGYAKQLCAEYQDERGWWVCPSGRDNHHWDAAVYALAAADIVGIRNFRRQTDEEKPAYKVYSKGVVPPWKR